MEVRVPLTDLQIGTAEIEAVTAVLESRWLTSGGRARAFEERFAEMHGAAHAYAVSSCTAGLHLAFAALDIGVGDEVICPDLTFVATANAVRYVGAEPVLAGCVSDRDLTLCPRQVEALITSRTRAICLMHYAGFACDLDGFVALASKHGLAIVEDCAHAPLASGWLRGQNVALGTVGDVSCFSFFGTKNISTGEGGMVLTRDRELGERIDRMRTHGITVPTYDRHRKPVLGYDIAGLGFNYRFDDLRAALGLCQLDRLATVNAVRRSHIATYREELAGCDGIRVPFSNHDLDQSAAHLMVVQVDADAAAVRGELREAGIQTSKHYEPVSSFELYGGKTDGPAASVAKGLITLPLGPHLDAAIVREVCEALRAAVGRHRDRRAA